MGNIETATKFSRLTSISSILFRGSHWRCSRKNLFLNILQYSQENNCCIPFLIKMLTFRPAALLKRDSNTGVFLCILQIFIYFEIWKQLLLILLLYNLFEEKLFYEEKLWPFMVNKMFIEIRLCNPIMYVWF